MNRLQIFPVVLLLIAGLVATASAERQVTTSASEVAVVDFTSQMSAGGQSNPATSYSSQNPVFLPCVHSSSQGYRPPSMVRVSVDSSGRQANGNSYGRDMTLSLIHI